MSIRRLFAMLAAGVLIPVALVTTYQSWRFSKTAQSAIGHVTRLEAGAGHPRIMFMLPTGEEVTFVGGGSVSAYEDQSVQVLYDPASPRNTATIAGIGSLYFTPCVITMLAIGSLIVSWLQDS